MCVWEGKTKNICLGRVFVTGRITKGVGWLTPPPPTTRQKTLFSSSINPAFLAQKWSKSVSGYYKTKKERKRKKSGIDH